MRRPCTECGSALAIHSRADRRYCSTRCRTLAHRRKHGGDITAAAWRNLVQLADDRTAVTDAEFRILVLAQAART